MIEPEGTFRENDNFEGNALQIAVTPLPTGEAHGNHTTSGRTLQQPGLLVEVGHEIVNVVAIRWERQEGVKRPLPVNVCRLVTGMQGGHAAEPGRVAAREGKLERLGAGAHRILNVDLVNGQTAD